MREYYEGCKNAVKLKLIIYLLLARQIMNKTTTMIKTITTRANTEIVPKKRPTENPLGVLKTTSGPIGVNLGASNWTTELVRSGDWNGNFITSDSNILKPTGLSGKLSRSAVI